MNKNKHYLNLKKLVKNEIDQHDLNDVEKENIIKFTPYSYLIKIHLYEKHNMNLFTMMNPLLVDNLVSHVKNTYNIDGAMVDVGCWRGGSSIIMRYYNNKKKLYILDAFEHMSDNIVNKDDYKMDKECIKVLDIFSNYFNKQIIETSEEIVRKNFKKLNVSLNDVYFIKGNLKDKKFKFDKIDKISLLRIDCDFYKPTYNVLENLYPKVSEGGVIIFDDFNIPFLEEKNAVLDYLNVNNIKKEFINIGQSAYFIK